MTRDLRNLETQAHVALTCQVINLLRSPQFHPMKRFITL